MILKMNTGFLILWILFFTNIPILKSAAEKYTLLPVVVTEENSVTYFDQSFPLLPDSEDYHLLNNFLNHTEKNLISRFLKVCCFTENRTYSNSFSLSVLLHLDIPPPLNG